MKLSVGSNSQRGPRHGEAAGFRVPKDFSGEKERNGSNFIKAGGRGRRRRRKASAQRKIYAPTPPDRRSGPGFIRKGREQGRKEGRAEGRGEGRYEDFLSRTKVASLGLHFWGSPPFPSPLYRRQGSRFQTAPFTLQGPAVICHKTYHSLSSSVHLHSS